MSASNIKLKKVGLTIWLALPIILLILPADYFDHGAVVCPSKRYLDMECPGCGITRAIQHAIHFQFTESCSYNKGVIFILPMLAMVYIHVLGRILNKNWLSWMRKLY
jgi:hypothetical protein